MGAVGMGNSVCGSMRRKSTIAKGKSGELTRKIEVEESSGDELEPDAGAERRYGMVESAAVGMAR